MEEAINVVLEKFPRKDDKIIQYGTAGFRTKADDLPHVMCRVGLLAVLRSKIKKATIGVMITASHNPEEDNGVKLIDPLGDMLEMKWEKYATMLANASDGTLLEALNKIVEQENVQMNEAAHVFIARDTRSSSPFLSSAVECGVKALKGSLTDFGILTTPQLHYLVCCKNTGEKYGQCSEEGYYQKLSKAFAAFQQKPRILTTPQLHYLVCCKNTGEKYGQCSEQGYYQKLSKAFVAVQQSVKDTKKYSNQIIVDAANGVGADQLKKMCSYLGESLSVTIYNNGNGKLNHKCGADFVKVNQCSPEGITLSPGMKYASFDGDADRIVYFFQGSDNKFHLLDGDRIATLVAGYLKSLLESSGIKVNLGLIQTAYANGSSTAYITKTLQVPVACVATGVKHLHHKAKEFDIGVYFEANGHGTVLFSENAENLIRAAASNNSLTEDQIKAAKLLTTSIDLINQTVGDAISDMLLVEAILCYNGWTMEDWFGCYIDLPNRQLKVKVKDRTVIKTTPDEQQTTSPDGLQRAIDEVVVKFKSGRSFVRPSGTEDVVRVYAEADTQANADQLAYEVAMVAYNLAGGVGNQPTPPTL